MIRHLSRMRRSISTSTIITNSSSCLIGKRFFGTNITQQQRASSLGFSNNVNDHLLNRLGFLHRNSHIRQFGSKDQHVNNNSSNSDGSKGDQIIDRPDYESITDATKYTHEVKVTMPDMGDFTGGTIETWYKRPGDIIHRDEVICDIRTDSFTFGMLTDDDFDSIMGEILVQEESGIVDPGTVICTTFSEDKHHHNDGDEKDE